MAVVNFYHLGCKIPKGSIYIGRYNYKFWLKASKYANPFPIGKGTRGEYLMKYKKWLWVEIQEGRITIPELANLAGHDLVCYCKPSDCHGDTLLKAIEWAEKQMEK